MAKIFGQLEKAQLENTTSDTASRPKGFITYRTDLNVAKVSDGTSMIALIDESSTQTLSGKTLASPSITGATLYNQIATPSTPSSGFNKIYFKSDGKAYTLDSNGVEQALGSGSGSGGINYVTNPTVDSQILGFVAYADAAGTAPVDGTGGTPTITVTRSTSDPLRATANILITKTAANSQGQGMSYDITIDRADVGQRLKVSFDYEIGSGTFATGDLNMYAVNLTTGAVIQMDGFQVQGVGTPSKHEGCGFQTSGVLTELTYRIVWHIASTSALAWTVKLDNVVVGPQTVATGAAMSDWTTYSLTVGGSSSAPTLGTNTQLAQWRRVGDSMEITYRLSQTASGSGGSGTWLFPLPSGYSIDTNKIKVTTNGSGADGNIVGVGLLATTVTANTDTTGNIEVVAYNSTNLALVTDGVTNNQKTFAGSTYGSFGAAIYYSFTARVPIAGWSSNAIVSDSAATRVVGFRAANTAGTSFTGGAGFVDVPFATVNDNTHGTYSSPLFTAPVPGRYRISFNLYTVGVSMTTSQGFTGRFVVTGKSSGNYDGYVDFGNASASKQFNVSATITLDMNAGDTVKVQGASDVTVTLNVNFGRNYFEAYLVQGPSQIQAATIVSAAYYVSADYAVGANAAINFDTKIHDTTNSVTTGAGGVWKFTAPGPGIYRLTINGIRNPAGGGTMFLYKNGVKQQQLTALVTAAVNFGGTVEVQLNAGDYISANSDSAITIDGDSLSGGTAGQIYISRISGVN